jgi:hypothetical protein
MIRVNIGTMHRLEFPAKSLNPMSAFVPELVPALDVEFGVALEVEASS